jgi:hypothetical protein
MSLCRSTIYVRCSRNYRREERERNSLTILQDQVAFFRSSQSVADYDIVLPFCHPEYHRFVSPYGLLHGPYSIRRRCIAGRYVHRYSLDYILQFFANYASQPKAVVAGYLSFCIPIGRGDRDIQIDID